MLILISSPLPQLKKRSTLMLVWDRKTLGKDPPGYSQMLPSLMCWYYDVSYYFTLVVVALPTKVTYITKSETSNPIYLRMYFNLVNTWWPKIYLFCDLVSYQSILYINVSNIQTHLSSQLITKKWSFFYLLI